MKRFKVKYITHIPQGFIGMNFYAARELCIDFPYPDNFILILKGMSKDKTKRTIMHEKIEATLMFKGMKYHEAHIQSNRLEDVK